MKEKEYMSRRIEGTFFGMTSSTDGVDSIGTFFNKKSNSVIKIQISANWTKQFGHIRALMRLILTGFECIMQLQNKELDEKK